MATDLRATGTTTDAALSLFDLLRCSGFDAAPDQCKLHLAVHNGTDNPLDVFLAGDFQEWQDSQNRRNFERDFVISLIQIPGNHLWLFVGCFKVLGCTGVGDTHKVLYQTEPVETSDQLIARLVLRFPRPGRQSYLNVERWVDRLHVHELKSERLVVQDFPGFKNVRLTKSELDLIVSHSVPSWKAALSSVGGIYVITDLATGKLYVGSATGDGGIWQRWVDYQRTGHGGNRDLRRLLEAEGSAHASNFQFAVLETADTHADQEQILAREIHWKQVLGTREHGYNGN